MEKALDRDEAIPAMLNLSLAIIHILSNFCLIFVVPLCLLPLSPWWALALVPMAGLSNSFWSLIHEAIHDMFHPSRRINMMAGRLLAVFFGSPFRLLRLSHLLHHKLNRTPVEGTELYDPEKTSKVRACIGYYFQILGGLYLLEVLSPLLFYLPRRLLNLMKQRFFSRDDLSGLLMRSLMRDDSVTEMRADGLATLGLFASSLYCYGQYWPMLLGALLFRAFLISFLDNVYHYGTPVNDIFYAENLWLPGWMSRLFLHFNLHGIHHRNPSLPWIVLRRIFREKSMAFESNYFLAAARQLAGPIPLSDLPMAARGMSKVAEG